jgi:hypothetical protein
MAHVQRNIVVELGGAPDELGRDPGRKSIRARIHSLEDNQTSQQLAREALQGARDLHAASAEKRFSRREKLAGLVFAFLMVISPYLAPLIIHHPA